MFRLTDKLCFAPGHSSSPSFFSSDLAMLLIIDKYGKCTYHIPNLTNKAKPMWIKTHTTTVTGIKPHQIWKIWADINNRPQWDLDTEWAELKGPFQKGAVFRFKPKGGPKLSMTITDCVTNQTFTDCFKMPFARLYGIHKMEPTQEGLKISTSIKVEGLLGWLLRKIVAEKVVAELPAQTAMLIQLASSSQ